MSGQIDIDFAVFNIYQYDNANLTGHYTDPMTMEQHHYQTSLFFGPQIAVRYEEEKNRNGKPPKVDVYQLSGACFDLYCVNRTFTVLWP